MNKLFRPILIILFFIFSTLLFNTSIAQVPDTRDCKINPYLTPTTCDEKNITIDSNCQTRHILNPGSADCCILICKNSQGSLDQNNESLKKFSSFNIFGSKFNLDLTDAKTVELLVSLFVSTILGIVSLYALLKGAYLAAFKRPEATTAEDIASINKEFTSLVVGFTVAWGLIFLVQIVFGILGLGNIRNMELFNDQNGIVITVKGK